MTRQEDSDAGPPPPDDPAIDPVLPDPADDLAQYRDAKDADTKEVLAYSLGGIIDDVGNAGFRNLTALVTIGFGLSPLLMSFLNAIKTLWDGIGDPIMAYISDNFQSRWGRRRPFIFVGSILIAVISWVTWAFIPGEERLPPNTPVVPEEQFLDGHWRSFGNLLLAYSVPNFDVTLSSTVEDSGQPSQPDFKAFTTKIWKELSLSSQRVVTVIEPGGTATPGSPLYQIDYRLLEQKVPLDKDVVYEAGELLTVEATLRGGELAQPIVARGTVRLLDQTLTKEKKRDLNFLYRVYYLFAGSPEDKVIEWESAHGSVQENIILSRAGERALLAGLYFATMEVFGKAFDLPYWRAMPSEARIDSALQQTLADRAIIRLTTHPQAIFHLAAAHGLPINPKDAAAAEKNRALLDALRLERGWMNDEAAYRGLWESVEIESGASIMGVINNPIKGRQYEGTWAKLRNGFAGMTGSSPEEQHLILFIFAMYMLMATAGTIYSAPYYAMGIEVAPSYNGRTKVVAFRTVFNGLMSIVGILFFPFILLPAFHTPKDGAFLLSSITLVVGIIATFFFFFGTREHVRVVRAANRKPSFWRSVKEIGSIWDFWRILLLYVTVGQVLGAFIMVDTFVSTYYVFRGNLLLGASYGAGVALVASLLGTWVLPPLIYWLCQRFEKHNAFKILLGFLIVGTALKYWCYNPEKPEMMFILPFFFSLGIAGVYTVLSTMMGDVTDLDELRNGERREGMFGAVMAVLMKSVSTIGAVVSGLVIVLAGFEISKGYHQDPGVYDTMRILFSFVPAAGLTLCYFLFYKFNLTRARVNAIKEELVLARQKLARQSVPGEGDASAG